ncbi:hypothetical protein DU508_15170 [Pedobacter chinensis]|uniref:Peptidase M56 domain-containing protein n=1 Tax=Pedobacter chinensis TaxID=2282421 RepID=A0A369PXB1_9SPHI|nr:M56 family metallopeptidase [Pedobacter chinensis]RDC55617.1 hypothetical protein DU508_15170 [Pedobacter chinensis]
MPHFFLILLKINLVLILFSVTYYLILRRLTFYSLNRAFLVFGIVFSSAYPFIDLTDFFSGQKAVPAFIPRFNQNVKQFVQQDSVSMFWQILTVLFYAGVFLMAMRLMVQFISLRRMHKKSEPGKLKDFNVRILNEEVSPFSFWQTIYINPGMHKPQDLGNILEHEKVHVEEWHTLDIILAEICVVFYWFNPGVWLMKKAVRENIEFITDARILKKGIDKKAYQYSLLDVGTLQASVAIVNNFNLSDLKKRIKMMNTKRSSKVNLTRYLLALPVLLCVTLAFTIDKKEVRKSLIPLKNMVIKVLPENKPEVVVSKPFLAKIKAKQKVKDADVKLPDSARNVMFVFNTDLESADTSHQSIANMLNNQHGKVKMISIKMKDDANGKMIMQNFTFKDTLKLESELTNVMISGNQSTDFLKSLPPAKDKIQKVIVIKSTFKTVDTDNDNLKKLVGNGKITTTGTDFFLNGNKISKEEFDKLNLNQISTINVDKSGPMAFRITTKP